MSNWIVRKAAGFALHCYTSTLLEDTNHQDEEGVRDTGANIFSGELEQINFVCGV